MEQQNNNATILTDGIITLLDDLKESLSQAFEDNLEGFTQKIEALGEKISAPSSHCRHIIEAIQAVLTHTDGTVNYAHRKHDEALTSDIPVFNKSINTLKQQLQQSYNTGITNKQILINKELLTISTTHDNELSYLLEHTMHHMAIIKSNCMIIGIQLHSNFGKAYSTISYEISNSS